MILESVSLSATIATAPESVPVILSPMIKSDVFPATEEMDVNVILVAVGSAVSKDSKIPNTSRTSPLLIEIFSSCTLVPNGKVPKDNPSFRVVAPIPDPFNLDAVITTLFTLFFLLIFAFGFSFLIVVINFASMLAAKSVPMLLI